MYEFCAAFLPLPVSYFPHLSNLVDTQGNTLGTECIESSLSGLERLNRHGDGLEATEKDNSLNYNRQVQTFCRVKLWSQRSLKMNINGAVWHFEKYAFLQGLSWGDGAQSHSCGVNMEPVARGGVWKSEPRSVAGEQTRKRIPPQMLFHKQ